MALTAKQQRFVAEYLIDLNATQAAIRAGYSEKTAYSVGHENLKKPDVQAGIQAAMKSRSDRTKIDADWVLQRLAAQAEADMAELFDDHGALRPVKDWPEVWRKGLVAGVDVFEEFAGQGAERQSIGFTKKIKLADRLKNLELIGKHVDVGAFKEKVEHSGEIKTPELKLVLHGTKPPSTAN